MATTTDPISPPTASDVCLLTKADGHASAADRYATDLCPRADGIVASRTPQQKADLLARAPSSPAGCRRGGLTADQAATLVATAALI